MADFLNVKDLPIKDAFEDGDNILVLSGGKLYRCPEGGGGKSYAAELTIPCEWDPDEEEWTVPMSVYVDDDVLNALYDALDEGSVTKVVVRLTTGIDELLGESTVCSSSFLLIPPDTTGGVIGAPAKVLFWGYSGGLILANDIVAINNMIIMPESMGG